MTTLDLIQQLSNERQHLYRLAGKQKLRPEQRERIQFIAKKLESLWDIHRRELSDPNRVFIEDRMNGDLFSDFKDLQQHQRHGARNTDWDGFHIEVERAKEDRESNFVYAIVVYSPLLKNFGGEVLREVLAELKQRDRIIENALRHSLTLAELRKRQHATPMIPVS